MKFLDRFKTAAQSAQHEEDKNMSTNTEAALAVEEKNAELSVTLSGMQNTIAEMQSIINKQAEQLASLEVEKTSLAEKAKAVVQASRKEKLEAVLGTTGAVPVLASLESADDATFNTMLSAFVANREGEAKSTMFNEQGATGKSKEVAPVEEDTAKRLEAKIKSQFAAK